MKIIDKPWGREIWLAYNNGLYAGKILEVKKGESLSEQYHTKKHETLYIQKGCANVKIDGKINTMKAGSFIVIPPMRVHKIEAIEDCTFIEFSSPELDDVVRISDKYGRCKSEG